MALENSMLVMNGKQVGGNFQDLTGYQTKADNNLETESKEIAGAINELRSEKADTDIVAADFNAGTSYTAGNYCIYEGKFYRFKNSHWGAWAAADVDEIKIAGELASLKSGLNGLGTFVPLANEEMPVAAQWTDYQDISINVNDYRYIGIRLIKENSPTTGTPLCLFSRAEFLASNTAIPLAVLFNTTELNDSYNVYVCYNEASQTPLAYFRGTNVTDTLYLYIVGIV